MITFWATSEVGPDGKPRLSMGSDYNRARFADHLKKNKGMRYKILPYTPESRKQRKFFEGGIVPLIAYYQANIDFLDDEDLIKVRDWLKIEFNGKFITLGGKAIKIPGSTRNELNRGFLERILDWMEEQGYDTSLLSPEQYKDWHDRIFPTGGPRTYIEYLIETGKLPKK